MSGKHHHPLSRRVLVPLVPCLLIVATIVCLMPRDPGNRAVKVSGASSVQGTPSASPTPPSSATFESVQLRPLPVSLRKGSNEWTEGDCSDPLVIEKLAHNPDEFIRMAEENERIKRRQLVYRRETAAALVQQARATGEPVRKLTLPGMDGREIHVEVTGSDLALSGLSGTFTGRVAGQQQSIVTVAFKNNREAFSVSSPEENLFLEAEPREPGEVIIKEIDPATYVSGKCGNDPNH